MTINALQEQINVQADARLRRRIDERLDPIRGQSAQRTRIRMTPLAMVNLIADAAFNQRRDQARNKATRDFLDKVAQAGIER